LRKRTGTLCWQDNYLSTLPFSQVKPLESSYLHRVWTTKVWPTQSMMLPRIWSSIFWWMQSLNLPESKPSESDLSYFGAIFRVHFYTSSFSSMMYLLFYTFNAHVKLNYLLVLYTWTYISISNWSFNILLSWKLLEINKSILFQQIWVYLKALIRNKLLVKRRMFKSICYC
jgi:hypothetical protein